MIGTWVWRHRLALSSLVAIPLATFILLHRAPSIWSYRVTDERTLVVTTGVGPGAWTRLGSVVETPESITITIRSFHFQLGTAPGLAVLVDIVVQLRDPIGDRQVIDGSLGTAIPREQ